MTNDNPYKDFMTQIGLLYIQLYASALVPARSLFLRALAIGKSAQIPDRAQPDDFGLEVLPFKWMVGVNLGSV